MFMFFEISDGNGRKRVLVVSEGAKKIANIAIGNEVKIFM